MKPQPGRRGIRLIALLLVALLVSGASIGSLTMGSWGGRAHSVPDDAFRAAKRAYAEMDFSRAVEILQVKLPEHGGDPDARVLLGRTLMELGRLKEAQEHFGAVLKENSRHFQAVLGLGEAYLRLRRYRPAIHQFKHATQIKPVNARAWRLLGMAQYQGGDSIGSLFSFRKSLGLLPGQEDLSGLMNEIGTARNRQRLAGSRSQPGRRDPFDPFGSQNPFGRQNRGRYGTTPPTPGIPDPLQGLPIPGRRRR